MCLGSRFTTSRDLARLQCRSYGQDPNILQPLSRRDNGDGPPLHGVVLYGPGAF